jgi:D-alanyl-D-alanine dipeptidase
MKWLIDCDDLAIPLDPDLPPVRAMEQASRGAVIGDNGEPLVPLTGKIRVHPVYSWLGFEHSPKDIQVRSGILDLLIRASRGLPADFDIVIIDAHRTRAFQAELLAYYQAGSEQSLTSSGYVSDPYSQTHIPPHATGGAVDLTLGWRGAVLGLGTDFDSFSELAAPAALEDGRPGRARDLRRLLASVLYPQGMVAISTEWWHWSYGDQYWAQATGNATAVYGEILPETAADLCQLLRN